MRIAAAPLPLPPVCQSVTRALPSAINTPAPACQPYAILQPPPYSMPELAAPEAIDQLFSPVRLWEPRAVAVPLWGAKGPTLDDVQQGQLADCFVSAAIAAVIHCNPDGVKDMVHAEADGGFVVRLRERKQGVARALAVPVSADLWARRGGGIRYAQPGGAAPHLGAALLEKAIARAKGGYSAIGFGGSAGAILQLLTGAEPSDTTCSDADRLWKEISASVANKRPGVLATFGEEKAELYKGSGVHPWHCYTLLDCRTDANGSRWVRLRNPWGHGEPAGDGVDDGQFWLSLEKTKDLFQTFSTVLTQA